MISKQGPPHRGRDVNLEESDALIRQIEAMAEPLGRRLYRGVLKTVARVWSPTEILDVDVLRKVLEQMQVGGTRVASIGCCVEHELAPKLWFPFSARYGSILWLKSTVWTVSGKSYSQLSKRRESPTETPVASSETHTLEVPAY